MTPQFMGAVYLMGAYFWTRAIFADRWHHVGNALIPTTLFASLMLIATVLHWDRFNHQHIWFHVWLATYVVTPILVPLIWYRNQRTDPIARESGDPAILPSLRWFLYIAGAILLVCGLAMIIRPQWFVAVWPWQLTPLTGRVIGGWYAMAGLAWIVAARDERWSASKIVFEGAFISQVLLIVAVLRSPRDIDWSNPLAWIYVGSLLVFIGVTVGYYVAHERRARRTQ